MFSLIREVVEREPDINQLPASLMWNLGMGPDLKLNLQTFGISNETQANWVRASLIILTPPKTFLSTFTWNKFQLHYASKV